MKKEVVRLLRPLLMKVELLVLNSLLIIAVHIKDLKNLKKLRELPHKMRSLLQQGDFLSDGDYQIGANFFPAVKEKTTWSYALTNYIFVDADGKGRFAPPLPSKIKIKNK